MKTNPLIITESDADRKLLMAILPKKYRTRVEFASGNGRSSAQSLAQSVLVVTERPVVLVLDSDTTDRESIEDLRGLIDFGMRAAAAGKPYKLILAEPEIEILLVSGKNALSTITQSKRIEKYEWAYAKQVPRKYLKEKLGKETADFPNLLKNLPENVMEEIRKHPIVTEITNFLDAVDTGEKVGERAVGDPVLI